MDTPEDEKGQQSDQKELSYEEMPVIDPATGETLEPRSSVMSREDVIPEAARVFQTHSDPMEASRLSKAPTIAEEHVEVISPKKRPLHMGTVLFIFILFGLGIWLSSQLRTLFAPSLTDDSVMPTSSSGVNPSFAPTIPSSTASAAGTQWVTYQPMNGITKQPISGLSYKLPSTVAAPVCDSASCSSQGTNLPGGTRLTVAPRGKGQLLPDFRGAILTDASGHEFTMKQTVIGGVYVYEYSGTFTGRTGGGYTFTKMRGALVPVSDILAIDFNHFSPVGVSTDFSADDALFEQIVQSFASAGVTPSTPQVIPSPTPTGTDMYGL